MSTLRKKRAGDTLDPEPRKRQRKDVAELSQLDVKEAAAQSAPTLQKKRAGDTLEVEVEPRKRQRKDSEEPSQLDIKTATQSTPNLPMKRVEDIEPAGNIGKPSQPDVAIIAETVAEKNPLIIGHSGNPSAKVRPAMVQRDKKPSAPVPPTALFVRIRLFKRPKDILHTIETEVQCTTVGEVDLEQVEKQLQIGRCEVSSRS